MESRRLLNELISAALKHQASELWFEFHPDDPYEDAEMELREDALCAAAQAYLDDRKKRDGKTT